MVVVSIKYLIEEINLDGDRDSNPEQQEGLSMESTDS